MSILIDVGLRPIHPTTSCPCMQRLCMHQEQAREGSATMITASLVLESLYPRPPACHVAVRYDILLLERRGLSMRARTGTAQHLGWWDSWFDLLNRSGRPRGATSRDLRVFHRQIDE